VWVSVCVCVCVERESIILNLCRYALVFPWAVTIALKVGVSLNLFRNLFLMFGKNCFVVLVASFARLSGSSFP